MKSGFNIKFSLALAAIFSLAVSCVSKGDIELRPELAGTNSYIRLNPFDNVSENRKTVLIYIAGDNSLNVYAISNKASLLNGYAPSASDNENILLLYYDIQDAAPVLERITAGSGSKLDEEILKTYPDSLNSATSAVMNRVLQDAESLFPAKSNGLIIWSHGSGWLPEGYYYDPTKFSSHSSPASSSAKMAESEDAFPSLDGNPLTEHVKSFAEHNGTEIDIPELADALPQRYEYIILDACLMGDIEVAYELKDKAGYLAFSPAEVLSDGLILYSSAVKYLFDPCYSTAAALQMVLYDGFEYYDTQTGIYRSATVSLIDCSRLEALANSCKDIYAAHRSVLDAGLSESGIQGYYRFNRHWFYDLDDVMSKIATTSEYASFYAALNKAVIYKASTPQFYLSFYINAYSGLGTYVYEPSNKYLNAFYKTLAWNKSVLLVP